MSSRRSAKAGRTLIDARPEPAPVSPSGDFGSRAGAFLVVLVLGIGLALRLPSTVSILTFPYDLVNALEGSFVTEAVMIREGATIYTGPHLRPFLSQPYPPVFASLVSLALPFFDAPILAGRWTGFAFLVWHAALAFVFLRRETGSVRLAAAGSVLPLFLLSEQMFASHYHPFHLAVFCAGIATVRRHEGARGPWLLLVVLAAAAAGWTRQTGLLVPVLCAAALWPRSRHDALAVLAYAFTLIFLFHGALGHMTDGEYFRNSFLEARSNHLRGSLFRDSLRYLALNALPLLVLCGVLRATGGRFRPAVRTMLLMGGGWLCASAVTSAKVGSNVTHSLIGILFLWTAALLLVARARGRAAVAAALCLAAVAAGHYRVPGGPTEADWRNGEELRRLVRECPGPVLTDRHLALLLPDHRPEYDLARVWEMRRYLPHPITRLLADLRGGRYPLVLTSRFYDTEESREVFDRDYRVEKEIYSERPFFYRFLVLRRATRGDTGTPGRS